MRQHRKRRGGRLHSAGRILSSHPLADLSASEADHPVNTVYTIAFQEVQGNDSNLLIVFYVQIMPDDFVMQLHRF